MTTPPVPPAAFNPRGFIPLAILLIAALVGHFLLPGRRSWYESTVLCSAAGSPCLVVIAETDEWARPDQPRTRLPDEFRLIVGGQTIPLDPDRMDTIRLETQLAAVMSPSDPAVLTAFAQAIASLPRLGLDEDALVVGGTLEIHDGIGRKAHTTLKPWMTGLFAGFVLALPVMFVVMRKQRAAARPFNQQIRMTWIKSPLWITLIAVAGFAGFPLFALLSMYFMEETTAIFTWIWIPLAMMGVALMLLAAGRVRQLVLLRRVFRADGLVCHDCGYALTSTAGRRGRCSECGVGFDLDLLPAFWRAFRRERIMEVILFPLVIVVPLLIRTGIGVDGYTVIWGPVVGIGFAFVAMRFVRVRMKYAQAIMDLSAIDLENRPPPPTQ